MTEGEAVEVLVYNNVYKAGSCMGQENHTFVTKKMVINENFQSLSLDSIYGYYAVLTT